MEKEKTIRIKDLVKYILRKWRMVLLCMIIFAVLLDAYSCLKTYRYISSTSTQEDVEDYSQYENKLSETEISEVKNAAESYMMYMDSYAAYKDYNNNSIKMQLNANAVSTQKIIYQITGNKNDVTNIGDTLVETVPNDSLCQKVLQETGWDVDESYIKELITVSNTHMNTVSTGAQNITDIVENDLEENISVLITVNIIAENKEDCEILKKAVEEEINVVKNDLQEQFGEFHIKKISDTYGIDANKDLLREQQNSINEMNNSNNSMQTLENNFTDDQKNYFKALINGQTESSDKKKETKESLEVEMPEIQYINIKYIVVGAALGFILCCIYVVGKFFLDSRLLSPNYILDELNSEVLKIFNLEGRTEKNTNKIDKWINSLFVNNHGFYTEDEKLEMLCTEIQIIGEKSNIKQIHISTSIDDAGIEDFMLKFCKQLEKLNLQCTIGKSIIYGIESLQKFSEADAVIFVEQLNKTLAMDINQETEMCSKYGVKNLGFVLIEE